MSQYAHQITQSAENPEREKRGREDGGWLLPMKDRAQGNERTLYQSIRF